MSILELAAITLAVPVAGFGVIALVLRIAGWRRAEDDYRSQLQPGD